MMIRRMGEADLAGADDLRRLAGWNQTPADWARMLRLEPAGCFVATLEGLVVGTVTTTTYSNDLAWIGMMLVHPEHRRRGIGFKLMHEALGHLRDRRVRCVKLDATPAGLPLYEKLGFVSEWTLTRHQRPGESPKASGPAMPEKTRPLAQADWQSVSAIDQRAFGAARPTLLRGLAGVSRRALVWPKRGQVLGWGLLRSGARTDYLGPLECSSEEGALELAADLLREAADRPVFWDIPDLNPPAQALARQLGFTPVRPLTRMRLGPETVVNGPQAQYAIADPAVG